MKLIWIPRTISTLSYPIASRGYIFFRGMEIWSMSFYSLRSKLIQPTNINSLNIWFLNINKKIIKYIRLYFAKMWSATVLSQILDNRLCPWPDSMHMKVSRGYIFFRGMEILSMPLYSLRSKLFQPTNINSLNIWFLNITKRS